MALITGNKQVPLLDLPAQYRTMREEILAAIGCVLDSQKFILGEEVERLEAELAPYCGSQYAVGCASGSDALLLALMALGIGAGDEVLTAPYTFFATAGSISQAGAVPVFADIEEGTFNIDVRRAGEALEAHPKIRAIIVVHLFGGCADMDPILKMAGERGIPVIEDAAQSIGAEYKGRRAGGMGRIGCFSFYPTKNLGGYGDGGLVTTNDAELAAKVTALRSHGSMTKYIHPWVGMNSHMDAIQAAVLRVKLRYLDGWSDGRGRNAELYRSGLAKAGAPMIAPAPAPYQTRHIYNQFVMRAPRRDDLQAYLKQHGIGTEVYYPLPLHLQPCYTFLGHKVGDFPVSERLADEALALPIHSELAADDIEYVCETIGRFYRGI
jgi:dTDP-4-amino-4,6-dideoxygalactose transaminase